MRFTTNRDVAIGVENLEKSRKFYEETLGLKPVETCPGRAVYDAGHLTLYIIEGEPHPPVLSFTVENLRAAKRRLLEGGCDIVDERERSLYFRDPAGVVFDAIQPT
jgi:catechol 2,3-dioxygenase-like lactoylglutathione lyase family enzyme